ncbi:MAG: hypothetical protein ACI88H_004123, partial [Cocleimonas sp.]
MCYSIIRKNLIKAIITLALLTCFGVNHNIYAYNTRQANEFLNAYEALSKGRLYESDHLKGYILH